MRNVNNARYHRIYVMAHLKAGCVYFVRNIVLAIKREALFNLGQQALNQQEYMNRSTKPAQNMTAETPSNTYSSCRRFIT